MCRVDKDLAEQGSVPSELPMQGGRSVAQSSLSSRKAANSTDLAWQPSWLIAHRYGREPAVDQAERSALDPSPDSFDEPLRRSD